MRRNHAQIVCDAMRDGKSFIAYSAGSSFGILYTDEQKIVKTVWKCSDGAKFVTQLSAARHANHIHSKSEPKSVTVERSYKPTESMKTKWRKMVEQERKHRFGCPVYLIEFDGENLTLEGGIDEYELREACVNGE